LVALAARIQHMCYVDRHLVDLPDRAMEIFRELWPGEAMSANMTLIYDLLRDACRRIREWKWSSARAGDDAALRFACSWYEELDLDALHSLHGNAPTDTNPALTSKREDRAHRIAEFAHVRTFIPLLPASKTESLTTRKTTRKRKKEPEKAMPLQKKAMPLRKLLKPACSPQSPEVSVLYLLVSKHCRLNSTPVCRGF
jgi:hypothetical protein